MISDLAAALGYEVVLRPMSEGDPLSAQSPSRFGKWPGSSLPNQTSERFETA